MSKNTKHKIAVVLPAYNGEATIQQSLERVVEGVARHPQHDYHLFIVDDGSTDGTCATAERFISSNVVPGSVFRNERNQRLVKTLKRGYTEALASSFQPTYLLRTDTDTDFDQSAVFDAMLPLVDEGVPVAAGMRWRPLEWLTPLANPEHEKRRQMELARRAHILPILERELGVTQLDPPSCGTQLYTAAAARHLLAHPLVANYSKDWGLDFLMPLVGARLGYPLRVENIERGKWDPQTRPLEKIALQYDTYLGIIGSLTGKTIDELGSYRG